MEVFTFQDFLINLGYPAVFALTLMRSLGITAFLPIPQAVTLTAAIGLGLNPLIVGVLAGFASTLGDTVAYFVGSGVTRLFKHKKLKVPPRLNTLLQRKDFFAALVASGIPLPLLFGIGCGSLHYDFRKFILASLIGKVGISLLVAYGASYGLDLIRVP